MTPRTNVSSWESKQSILSRTISTIVLLTPLFQQNCPTDTIVPVGFSHINCSNPIYLYLLIRYNRIIYKPGLFPNSPKYLVSDHNISKIRLKMLFLATQTRKSSCLIFICVSFDILDESMSRVDMWTRIPCKIQWVVGLVQSVKWLV